MGHLPPDGAHSVRFEVRDGMRRVDCAVSDEALEAVADLGLPSTSALRRRSFDRFRTLIDAAAKLKLRSLPGDFAGPLMISAGDLRRVPPEAGVPKYGSGTRHP